MEPRAKIRQLAGKQLLCTARNRALVTDRPIESGGTDLGYTSGELLLLAIGSCATGGLRIFFESKGLQPQDMVTEVFFEPTVPGERDRIVIELALNEELLQAGADEIKAAATSGRVASRVNLGSVIDVRFAGR